MKWIFVVAGLLLLSGCINDRIGPTVYVRPGPGRTFEGFQQDMRACMVDSKARVSGQFDAANLGMISTTVAGAIATAATAPVVGDGKHGLIVLTPDLNKPGTSARAAQFAWDARNTIQQNYDLLFSQCMLAKGDEIPGPESQSDVTKADK